MTRLLVLGMLDIQPMSGYDMKQLLQMTDAERWGGVLVGSIYHALKKMEEEGLVEITSIEQTGHRQKAIYQITENGKEHLNQLTKDALKASSVIYPTLLYSGLSYLHKLPKDEALSALKEQANALSLEYQTLEEGLKVKTEAMDGELPSMTRLIFENMFVTIQQQQDFITKAIELLNSQV